MSRGSAESRRLRKQGLIPGVLYGRGKTPHADLASPSASCAGCSPAARAARDPRRHARGPEDDPPVDPQGVPAAPGASGGIIHVDLQEVRLDQPIQARVVVELDRRAGRRDRGRRALRRSTARSRSRRCRWRFPSTSSSTSAGWRSATRCASSTCRRSEGVKYLDDPEETVLATVTMPTRDRRAGARGGRGRGARRGRAARGRELPEGEEAPAEGESPAEGGLPDEQEHRRGIGASLPSRRERLDAGPARRGPRQPGPRVRADPRHNAGWLVLDELARQPRRLLALEVLGLARGGAARRRCGSRC